MTVKLRLVLAFSVLIVASIVIGLSALMQISKIDTSLTLVVDDRVPKLLSLQQANQRRVAIERDIAQMILARDQDMRDAAHKRIKRDMDANAEVFRSLELSIKSTNGKALLAETIKARQAQTENNQRMLTLVLEGHKEAALNMYLSPETRQLSTTYRDAILKFIELQQSLSQNASNEGSAAAQNAFIVTIVVLLMAILIGVGFFLWIMRVVVRPVVAMQNAMQEVVRTGQFDKQVAVMSRDEIGLSVEALNNLLKSMQHAIGDANATIGALAQGDFSKRIEREYVGDLDKLKNGINGSADNVTKVMRELGRVMQSLHEGQFNVVVNTHAQGEYLTMLKNTAEAMSSINGVIANINAVMEAMQQGQFQQRVSVEARGELNLMKQRINSSMQDLDSAMSEIIRVVVAQSEGNLTHNINVQYQGDLETLKQAVNASIEKLVEVVSKAVYASNIVSSAAEEVSRGSSDLSQRVQEQAAALEETSATMDQMNSAVQANTENAQQAAQVAKSVQLQASEGSRVMQQTIEAMNTIQQSSHKIADIVSLIDGIAFQTNLLALNAAVEAARAGEHGRGFAVVAGEVRALAHKSAEAAKDIKKLIDESVIRIDEGTHLASQSGSVLKGINEAINGVAGMVQQIAQASGEQSEGISQVHRAISQIDQVTQQNAALVEETTAAAESLSEQSIVLREDMAFFNTGRSSASVNRVKPRTSVLATLPKPKLGLDKSHYAAEKSANQKSPNEEWSDF